MMRNAKRIIEGKNIYLRKLKVTDVGADYCDWMNDPEVNQYLESRFRKWTTAGLKDYVRKINNSRDYSFLAVVTKDKNKHIGNIKLGPINRIHDFAEMGIVIGDKSFWGRGLATEAIKLAVAYAFGHLKLHKLTAGAYVNNIGSIKAFEKAGFSREGIKKKHYLYKDNYIDSVIMGQCRT